MKYNLRAFEGKNVWIICDDGQVFVGYASDYVFPEDNDDNIESIIIEFEENGALIELKQTEIESMSAHTALDTMFAFCENQKAL